MRLGLILIAAIAVAACSSGRNDIRDFHTIPIAMPNGKDVHVEVLQRQIDVSRGLMFRESLPPDRGIIFFFARPGNYPSWMYQVKIPLDIIWIDSAHRVVEISANTSPCPSKSAKECPNFGGTKVAQFVLEIGGGMAEKYNVRVGSQLGF
jgi:uncharacterized membrane protein (UPF0127 family)